jgi:hypothetical protein
MLIQSHFCDFYWRATNFTNHLSLLALIILVLTKVLKVADFSALIEVLAPDSNHCLMFEVESLLRTLKNNFWRDSGPTIRTHWFFV